MRRNLYRHLKRSQERYIPDLLTEFLRILCYRLPDMTMHTEFTLFLDWLKRTDLHPDRDDLNFLYEYTDIITLPKGKAIMEQNRPVSYFYFLNSGVARLFLRYEDDDITIAFLQAPQFASTPIYLLNRQLSTLAVETCTEAKALRWSREQFLAIKNHTHIGNAFETAFTEMLLSWNLEREIDRLTLSPELRYQKLIDQSPLVGRYVPVKYIASYLGIHHDSLSRIRNRMIKRI